MTYSLPLRWESTGDQWWFASPIDWAAANGHYDLVRELLYIDTNLLIKLTSLPRLRRLETVWDDNPEFNNVAKCRAHVAHRLFLDCENDTHNSLIRGGYGGWLLYTAAAAGDVAFVEELLGRDPLLVFGEGEYGVTDMLYAASRSKNCDVFRLLFAHVKEEASSELRSEMRNRAVHAAARGGNLEMLAELLGGGAADDVLAYRDARGSTLLHTASGRGQVEVVEHLISSYKEMMTSVDSQGNTALNVGAYRGHLPILELLISTSPSLTSLSNNYGDTFLHMAISGFLAPGFRRLDRQLDLIKRIVSGTLVDLRDIINVQNSQGRTALHLAVIENIKSDVVGLLMSVPYINLNIRDADGNTPLDLLKQRPHSEILIRRLISAGGISNCEDRTMRKALVSHLKRHGIAGSPGTCFRIPDSEIFLHLHTHTSCTANKVEASRKHFPFSLDGKRDDASDDCSIRSSKNKSPLIPLRLQFSRASSLPCNKRVESYMLPSASTKKKFTAGLTQGVLQLLPRPYYFGSPSESSYSSPISAHKIKRRDDGSESRSGSATQSPNLKTNPRQGSLNARSMNSYLCLEMDNSPQQGQDKESLVM
ncbi:hypothetical protein ACS0TY_032869 [Phlomoides rotata]